MGKKEQSGLGRKVTKAEPIRFEVDHSRAGSSVWVVRKAVRVRYPVISDLPTKNKAEALAGALNRAAREVLFTPKSHGRRARSKGHSFEREIAQALRCVFPKARRHLEYQDVEANGVDLTDTGVYRIQCKKLKKYAPLSMMGEIECDPALGDIPVLVTAADGKPPVACLPFEDLVRLMKKTSG